MATAETIFAPASGQGTAGIAVIRISGTGAHGAVAALTDRPLPPPRQAALRRFVAADGALLDIGLLVVFAEGASFTGEAMAEIHAHGGRAVVRALLEALGAQPGLRLAEPGEFTLRAFEAGRIDMAEAEALADLLAAETEGQRRRAAAGLGGALHARAEAWRGELLEALALIEVTIDWADEEVPEDVSPEVRRRLRDVAEAIARELATADRAERLRAGFEVAILGAPNAGKSSLLNALAGREAALTSPVPGTTRDVIELRYDLDGLAVAFLDMAGLRETADPVEAAGVARARARAEAADLRLILTPADGAPAPDAEALARPGDLRLWSKADLAAPPADALAVSAETGAGIETLLRAIADRLGAHAAEAGLVAHARQARALESGLAAIRSACEGLETRGPEEISEEVRSALRALERLIGRVGTEDVLGAVFARFCLGK